MADFPVFSSGFIDSDTFGEHLSQDGDLSSKTEAGYRITRRKFTRRPKTFEMTYVRLNDVDKVTAEACFDEHGTTGSLNWIHPLTSAYHEVRLVEIPAIKRAGIYWQFSCELEEV